MLISLSNRVFTMVFDGRMRLFEIDTMMKRIHLLLFSRKLCVYEQKYGKSIIECACIMMMMNEMML